MHTPKSASLLVALSLSSAPLLAQEHQDPFLINIKKDDESNSNTTQVESTTSGADEGQATAGGGGEQVQPEAEDDLQVGIVVEEGDSSDQVVVEGVEVGEGAGGDEEIEVPERGAESGDVDAQDDWTTVEIPQIKGSIRIPKDWHQPTAEQVLEALDFVKFSSDDERTNAEMGALSVGRMTFLVTKNPEPTEDLNPGVSITWEPMPLVFEQLPLEARSAGLARVLSTVAIPELKSKDDGFQLLEGPKAIDDEGGGAWVTFRATSPLKSGKTNESIVRLYVLPARDHIITAQITAPADREKGEEVLPELWAIFESLSYVK